MTYPREPHPRAPGATQGPPTPMPAGAPPYGPPAQRAMPSGGQTGKRMTLAPLVRSALDSAAERRQQRRRLVSTLILAQLLLTLAVSVGYFGSQAPLPILLALAAALGIYLIAFIVNHLLHHATMATYILVLGGGAAVTAQVMVTALSGKPLDTAQAALFYLAIVLEAGVLLSAEVTLIIAVATTMLSAAALLLALSLDPTLSHREAYLVMVYTLSLQALAGIIAWLLAYFVSESVDDAQRAQELQFAQARLEALRGQTESQRQQLLNSIAHIQATIARVFAGDHTLRVDIAEGELSDLANSLNVLLRRVEAAAQVEQERARMDAAVVPLVGQLGHMADPATPAPSMPLLTNTPMDSISIAVTHSHANIAHRLARVQTLASEVAGAVTHSYEGLSGATNQIQEAQRLAGLLISMVEGILASTQKQLDLVARTRRHLGGLLPPELAQAAQGDPRRAGANAGEAGNLQGLGLDLGLVTPGLTSEFEVLGASATPGGTADARDGTTIPLQVAETSPLDPAALGDHGVTVPLQVIETSPLDPADLAGSPPKSPSKAARTRAADRSSGERIAWRGGDLPGEVTEAWRLLALVADEIGHEERDVGGMARELGVLSRAVRQADLGLAWVVQALDAVRRDAEQLQQVAGSPLPPPEPGEPRPPNPSRPLAPGGGTPRAPQLARPLTEGGSRPLTEGGAGDEGPQREPADDADQAGNAAPGSVRASDLVNYEDLPGGEPPRA
ncbi:MAG TPA: hypothetical protein VFY89_02115 [Ktedonobacterales bacterium]